MTKKIGFFLALAFLSAMLLKGQIEMQGPLTKDEVLQGCPDWKAVAESYVPNPVAIEKLKSLKQEVRVEIYFGTWCPDSKAHVGEYFKIMELAGNPVFVTDYVGMARDKQAREPYIRGKNVTKLPTFIVSINGQEKGRIIEIPKKSVEEDLVDILAK
jgi:hypothetical protein